MFVLQQVFSSVLNKFHKLLQIALKHSVISRESQVLVWCPVEEVLARCGRTRSRQPAAEAVVMTFIVKRFTITMFERRSRHPVTTRFHQLRGAITRGRGRLHRVALHHAH